MFGFIKLGSTPESSLTDHHAIPDGDPAPLPHKASRGSTDLSNRGNVCVYLLGRRITLMNTSALVNTIHSACLQNRRITVANYNIHAFNLSLHLPWFQHFLQQAEIAHCDGRGILTALHWLNMETAKDDRVSYSDLMPKLLDRANQENWSVFLLGTKPHNLELALNNLRQQYPQATFNGHHGYFQVDSNLDNAAIVDQINQAQPQLLIVGMGMPIQEQWISDHRDQLYTNVILPGGAVIDRFAGVVSDCPKWLSDNSLEWCYRFAQEPRRLATRYLLGNPAFLLQIALAKFQSVAGMGNQILWHHPITEAEILATATSLKAASSGPKRIGECLMELGLVSAEDMQSALQEHRITGIRLGTVLADRGLVSQQTIERLVEEFLIQTGVANSPHLGRQVDLLAETLVALNSL
jgi:N-acetylglucosaminyldiphosphoundecaprenol N-acetyl-beta-D-mannosaminyltransferase